MMANSMMSQKNKLAIQLSIGKDSPPLCPVTAAAILLSISVLLSIFLTTPWTMVATIQPKSKSAIALTKPHIEIPTSTPN